MATTKTKKRRGKKAASIHQKRLKAISHPLRASCLRLLGERGEMSPVQVMRELGENLSDVSYHMKRLAELGCAEIVRERQVRGAVEHFYRATDHSRIDTDEWEELDPLEADAFVGIIMQHLVDDFVASRKAKIVGQDKDFHMTRTQMTLDMQGLIEGMELHERSRLEMAQIESRSVERRAKSGERGIPVSSSLMFFKTPRGVR
jgi:DNA-binding transcriptional ArsR family regulator